MRVTFLIRSLGYGGAERQLVELAKGLYLRGVDTQVVTFYQEGPLIAELAACGVPVYTLNKQGRWDLFGFLWRLVKIIRDQKPDILHGYLSTGNTLATLCKFLFPRLKVVYGVRASNVDLSQYDRLSAISYRVERWLSRFADLIIVNSWAGQRYWTSQGMAAQNMVVVPNGIDTNRFRPDLEARRRIRQQWGINDDTTILVGMVARFDPMKDHPIFLKAAALLMNKRSDVRFVCIGGGPDQYQNELQRLADSLGLADKMIWIGQQGDMPALYNALDIHVLSSLYGEGFPNVVGEAMACGVPCVATDVGDSALLIGDTGLIVPPKDPPALSTAVEAMIDRLAADKDLTAAVRQRIEQEFNCDQLVQRTLDLLQRL